ncbi:hypothetical protein U9M48_034774, partial [Paspalum notatum var. saurae]
FFFFPRNRRHGRSGRTFTGGVLASAGDLPGPGRTNGGLAPRRQCRGEDSIGSASSKKGSDLFRQPEDLDSPQESSRESSSASTTPIATIPISSSSPESMEQPPNHNQGVDHPYGWEQFTGGYNVHVGSPAPTQPANVPHTYHRSAMLPPLHQSPQAPYQGSQFHSNLYQASPIASLPNQQYQTSPQPTSPICADTEPIARAAPTRKNKQATKATSAGCSRGPNFSPEEDIAVVTAYLNVSRDPIVGANQTGKAYWERVTEYFNKHNAAHTTRKPEAVSHRWRAIAKEISCFCSVKAEIDRKKASGNTIADRLEQAEEAYLGRYNKEFQFKDCWELLRDTRKWQDWVSLHNARRARKRTSATISDSAADTSDAESPPEIPRPIGRDAAKKKRGSTANPSVESPALSLFERMATSREQNYQRQIEWATDNKEFQQQQLALKQQQVQAELERNKIQREQWDWTKFKDENTIMLMDLNNCSEKAKEYFLSIQDEILARRHGGPSGPSGSNN